METLILKPNNRAAEKAVQILRKGGVIIYPTETCYGIGADATSKKAVVKVIRIKQRPAGKRISVAVSSITMAKKHFTLNKQAERLARAFMPGPITLVVRSKKQRKQAVGFRIPDNKFILKLIRKLNRPITSTSANISDEPNLYRIKDVIKVFDGKVSLIIDGGNLPEVMPSTVFDTQTKKVLRKGPVSEKDILDALN
ncbi:MAG: threonylcarbamoyl-AMP synthase [Candidatus Aenigmarchaeota archaeon]|nr:threonylcarbamoyl-AMP synthase [Candidatus Aenigmarchaeota archaeon]